MSDAELTANSNVDGSLGSQTEGILADILALSRWSPARKHWHRAHRQLRRRDHHEHEREHKHEHEHEHKHEHQHQRLKINDIS
eukprot:CAMPEP_0119533378 /NCGR_PEP_ID=MMETSP1344-20130328/46785_1 /TAXON_ID=236787 /ORGANISM="Florenciella parvula, Strain CCMP2471" /LENGTH=82 /DNA_ID=CAMNT_0007574241 /DNA_START=93 /DNA_END=341 /DNA_ORIENTATION=-